MRTRQRLYVNVLLTTHGNCAVANYCWTLSNTARWPQRQI